MAAESKIWIYDTTIIDGSGKDRYEGSLLIEGDKITHIIPKGKSLPLQDARKISGKGLICAPGFIDTHSHSDLKVLSKPALLPKLHQGITTEVLGQDGVSMAPLPLQYISSWQKNLAGLEGENKTLDWTYQTTQNYLKMIEHVEPALNETYLLPHGNVRMEAMGLGNKEADAAEIDKMCRIVDREMKAGCLGLSSGLIYMPCAYGKTEELIEMCKVVREHNGIFVVHQRSEADDILTSMDEIIRIGKESGVKIHFSHFKVCGKNNWSKLNGMLQKLDEAKMAGIEVSFDQYPYIAGSTMLGVILPPWAHDGGTVKLMERLKDISLRKKMKEDISKGIKGWDNFVEFAGVDGIYITSVASDKNQHVVGLNLKELGEKWNKEPLDAAFDLLLEEENAVGMVDFYGTEDHVITILKRPEMNACTDGLFSGKPHPRVYGAFPRILGKYVREEKVLTLEEAIRKMTGKPAETFGLKERGVIREGAYADLVLFNEHTIADQGTFTDPEQYPSGIETVIVNGVITLENGKETGNRAGRVIKK